MATGGINLHCIVVSADRSTGTASFSILTAQAVVKMRGFLDTARHGSASLSKESKEGEKGIHLYASLAGPNDASSLANVRLDERIGNDDGWLRYYSNGGNFSNDIKRFWLLVDHILVAELPKRDGGTEITAMDLNGCLANHDGAFQWATDLLSEPKSWKFDLGTLGQYDRYCVYE